MTSKFNKPTYTNENRVVINTFSAMIPDGMRYFRAADDWRGKIEEDLCDKFEFIMVNDDYEGGFDQYHDARSLCMLFKLVPLKIALMNYGIKVQKALRKNLKMF